MLDKRIDSANVEPTKTSTGDRIEIIEVGDNDTIKDQLINCHFKGKMLKKEGEALFAKARRLTKYAVEKLLADRTSNRPKQFKFEGKVGSVAHTVSVNVCSGAYGALDADAVECIESLGLGAHVAQNVTAKVDFSKVPNDKQDMIASKLLELNSLVEDVVEVTITKKPMETFNEARSKLTVEQDTELNELVPYVTRLGR